MPGEYEESDVGVEPRLQMPGDSEYLVEGVLAEGKKGVGGGGRLCVSTVVRRLANSAGPVILVVSVVPFSKSFVVLREEDKGPAGCTSENVGHLGSFISLGCVACGMTRLSFCD